MASAEVELYVRELSAGLSGPWRDRRRLLAELRQHVDEAVAAEVAAGSPAGAAEHLALERLGPQDALVEAWSARCSRVRARRRGRAALLAAAVATAGLLGVAQHADGRGGTQAPVAHPCPAAHAQRPCARG
jgi:hypothetical protein